MGEYRLKIGVFAPTGSVRPKNFRYKKSPPPTILLVKKTRINDVSCDITMWARVSFIFAFLLAVFTQRNFVADFLQVKYNFTRKTTLLRF